MGGISRREFLGLSGRMLAAAVWPEWLRPPEGLSPLAQGFLTKMGGETYGNPVEILSVNSYFQYLIRDGKRTRYVHMKSVQITEGYPFLEIKTSERIGMRLDDPNLMEHVAPAGARGVRIYAPIEELGIEDSTFERAISTAETKGLTPLLVVLPTELREKDYIREKVGGVIDRHPTAIFNLGNEPENPVVEFWKDRDLETFSQFVMMALETIWEKSWQHGGQTLAVVAGLQNINNTERFLRTLRNAGLNFKNPFLRMGLHSYQGVWDLSAKLPIVRAAHRKLGLPMPKYWLTEVGVNYPGWSKWTALEMVQYGFAQGIERAYVHTLVDQSEGFALTTSEDGSVHLPTYYGFAALARKF